jgi:hypothetical protein
MQGMCYMCSEQEWYDSSNSDANEVPEHLTYKHNTPQVDALCGHQLVP